MKKKASIPLNSEEDKNDLINKLVKNATKKLKSKTRSKMNNIANNRKPKKSLKQSKKSTVKKENLPIISSTSEDESSTDLPLSQIAEENWEDFEKRLSLKKVDELANKLKICITKMQCVDQTNSFLTKLYFIRLGIVDSLFHRKWDNLLQFVLILSKKYFDKVFTKFIRHLCQILKFYHPAIRGTEYEEQIDFIVEKYDNQSNRTINLINIV